MNITVYLPDDLGQRAKDANLPLSRLLRDAVTARFDLWDRMQGALDNANAALEREAVQATKGTEAECKPSR